MKTFVSLLLTTLAFHAGALLTAVGFLAVQGRFIAGDLVPFWFWTGVLTIPLVLIAWFYARSAARRCVLAVTGAVLVGALFGYMGTLGVAYSLGPWFGAFDFPPLYGWSMGAIAACLVALRVFRRRTNHPLRAD